MRLCARRLCHVKAIARKAIMAAERGAKVQVLHSIVPYQVILHLNVVYTIFFTVCELLMYIYKAESLPMASANLTAEIFILLFVVGIEFIRIFFGKKGNLTEKGLPVGISITLSIPSIIGNVYLLIWQTYVLRAELILVSIQLSFIGLEDLLGLLAIILFSRFSEINHSRYAIRLIAIGMLPTTCATTSSLCYYELMAYFLKILE